MTTERDSDSDAQPVSTAASGRDPAGDELIEDELIIEEISIDGMCGVY